MGGREEYGPSSASNAISSVKYCKSESIPLVLRWCCCVVDEKWERRGEEGRGDKREEGETGVLELLRGERVGAAEL